MKNNSQPYSGILFPFSSMEMEIRNLTALAKPFLSRESNSFIIPGWLSDLKNIERKSGLHRWEISEKNPLKTNISEQYEPNGKSTFKIIGELSCLWEIRPLKQKSRKIFELNGIASTKLKIRDSVTDDLLAQWQFEVGDRASPGCHFHVGIYQGNEHKLFPKGLSVPRLPSMIVTPMDCLEYLLAELFQVEWERRAFENNDFVRNWAGHQKNRFTSLLKWNEEMIKNANGSPWTFLKSMKPTSEIFNT